MVYSHTWKKLSSCWPDHFSGKVNLRRYQSRSSAPTWRPTPESADSGAKFFADGVEELRAVPKKARPLVFQICTRQLVLSSSIALETYRLPRRCLLLFGQEGPGLTPAALAACRDVLEITQFGSTRSMNAAAAAAIAMHAWVRPHVFGQLL